MNPFLTGLLCTVVAGIGLPIHCFAQQAPINAESSPNACRDPPSGEYYVQNLEASRKIRVEIEIKDNGREFSSRDYVLAPREQKYLGCGMARGVGDIHTYSYSFKKREFVD